MISGTELCFCVEFDEREELNGERAYSEVEGDCKRLECALLSA